jgi:UDP-glucose 4-epimerase
LYETLLNREERAKAEDRGGYYRIPADVRDLNYSLYFSQGQVGVSFAEEYTSQNTHRMNQAEMVDLLLKLDCVQGALKTRTVTV